jgi:hypothetical protein
MHDISSLPTGLAYARDLSFISEFTKAKTADTEFSDIGVWTPAQLAAVLLARRILRYAL